MAASSALGSSAAATSDQTSARGNRPNVVFVFGDQWRAQATGYSGNRDVVTPNLDKLAEQSVNMTRAIAGCPVCSPYRASLMTGRYPLTHGVFLNDLCLNTEAVSIAQAYEQAGYDTAYIGKWHLDGHGRSAFIPPARRQGFEFWRVLECTHKYNDSAYYGHGKVKRKWPGYDAIAQTHEAQRYIREHPSDKPFLLILSWGPPHAPYRGAPAKYVDMIDPRKLTLRPNVPKAKEARARRDIAGYYAHIAALDDCIGRLVKTLDETGIADETILVFTSDHGDMLFSQGRTKKQKPWDESIRVPFLLRYPAAPGRNGRRIDMPFDAPDIFPTLLGLSGVSIPKTVEGADYSGVLKGTKQAANEAALIMCPSPFGQWTAERGGREFRGVRTRRHTYVRDLKGPWLLYDNQADPYQLNNLVGRPGAAKLQQRLAKLLSKKLAERNDEFLPGRTYIAKWGHKVDKHGTVPYTQ